MSLLELQLKCFKTKMYEKCEVQIKCTCIFVLLFCLENWSIYYYLNFIVKQCRRLCPKFKLIHEAEI